jgi:hypothetical protein
VNKSALFKNIKKGGIATGGAFFLIVALFVTTVEFSKNHAIVTSAMWGIGFGIIAALIAGIIGGICGAIYYIVIGRFHKQDAPMLGTQFPAWVGYSIVGAAFLNVIPMYFYVKYDLGKYHISAKTAIGLTFGSTVFIIFLLDRKFNKK